MTKKSTRGRKRERRIGEVVCRCGAYRFPHRMMGGNCNGGHIVAETFEKQMWGDCRDCPCYAVDEERGVIECQALEGTEAIRECPALIDFIRYEGIKLYGVNKPPEKRSSLRFRR